MPKNSIEHALAVLEAEKANLSPEQRKQLAELSKAGEAVRENVTGALEASEESPKAPSSPAIITAQSAEAKSLIETLKLEESYEKALETQKFFELLKAGEKAPDFGRVLKTFTPEMLAAAERFQNPTLILQTKGRSFNDLVSAMDGRKTMKDQRDAYVEEIYDDQADLKLEQWGAYIVDGASEMKVLREFDDVNLVLRGRLQRFAEYKKANGISGMDRWKYAHAMMRGLKEGKPVDAEYTWTMLDEDPALSDSRVPVAGWRPGDRGVYFVWDRPEVVGGDVRFRRSVGGDVQNS